MGLQGYVGTGHDAQRVARQQKEREEETTRSKPEAAFSAVCTSVGITAPSVAQKQRAKGVLAIDQHRCTVYEQGAYS